MVQSSSLSSKTRSLAAASATLLGKSNLPRKYAGGTMESLNRKATDTTITCLTPALCMALVSAAANCRRRFALAFDTGNRGPNPDKTAS